MVGKQGNNAVSVTCIILGKSLDTIRGKIGALFRGKHLHGLLRAVIVGEVPVADIFLFIFGCPFGIKGQCIDQIHDRVCIDLINHFFDHAVGVLLAPCVDVLQRGLIEWRRIDLRIVPVCICLQEGFVDMETVFLIAEPNRVSKIQLAILGTIE